MTLSEYMDPMRFPLTTRPAYSAREQFMMDAFNLDALRQVQAEGVPLTDHQRQLLVELEEKEKARTELLAQLGDPGHSPNDA